VPAPDVARVLGHQVESAADQVEAVHVEALRVTPVHRHQDVGGVVVGHVDDPGPHVVERGEVDRGVVGAGEVGGVDVEVLVAPLVLGVEDARGVPAPGVTPDAPDVVVGDAGVVVGADGAHPHVEAALLGS
jgi:hypothetical protein